MNTKEKFNLLVNDINSLNSLNTPLEVLNKFNQIRYTLSVLQDELVKESLTSELLDKYSIKEGN